MDKCLPTHKKMYRQQSQYKKTAIILINYNSPQAPRSKQEDMQLASQNSPCFRSSSRGPQWSGCLIIKLWVSRVAQSFKFGLFVKKVAFKINFSSTRAISKLRRSNCFCLGKNQTTPDDLFYCPPQSGKLTKRVRQQG